MGGGGSEMEGRCGQTLPTVTQVGDRPPNAHLIAANAARATQEREMGLGPLPGGPIGESMAGRTLDVGGIG